MDKITKHYSKAHRLAVEKVKKIALRKLRSNKNIDEFIMGMGVYFFTAKNEDNNDKYHCKELDDFINEWDSVLCITGEAMRFRSDGVITTDW